MNVSVVYWSVHWLRCHLLCGSRQEDALKTTEDADMWERLRVATVKLAKRKKNTSIFFKAFGLMNMEVRVILTEHAKSQAEGMQINDPAGGIVIDDHKPWPFAYQPDQHWPVSWWNTSIKGNSCHLPTHRPVLLLAALRHSCSSQSTCCSRFCLLAGATSSFKMGLRELY